MRTPDLFHVFILPLNAIHMKYMVTGAAGVIVYGAPRMTHDLDLVLEISIKDIDRMISAFPGDRFYCPPKEVLLVEIGRRRRGHFNLIHHETGFRADCYPTGDDPFHRWAMMHRVQIEYAGEPMQVAPPEYIIVRKLQYYQEGKSEKHILDIRSILENHRELEESETLLKWLKSGGVRDIWDKMIGPQ